jgi:pyruvate dehydrogenase E1 component alpha subunit
MNMAKVWNLPVLFICENNQYGIGTAIHRSTAVVDQFKRVCGYSIESAQCDGQDFDVVYDHARKAVAYVRERKGPYFLELMTYRYRGHSMSDARTYRSREEEETWKLRDPIFILRDRLIEAKVLTMDEFSAMEKEIEQHLQDEIIRFAEESPEPDVADLEKYVLA